MRVLVTGGRGFLGTALARRLEELGHDVTAIGRKDADLAVRAPDAHGMDVIFHCAARSSLWGPYREFHQANVIGTRHVVDAAIRAGVPRLIHVSSPSIYVGASSVADVGEDVALPRRGVNHYAETKRLAELEIDRATKHGIHTVTIRPQAIFGPGDPAIMPRLVRANAKSGLPLFGDGNHLMDVTYVDNVVDALLLCAEAGPATNGRRYNITNGEPIAFKTFLTGVFKEMGVTPRFKKVPYPLAWTAAAAAEGLHAAFRPNVEPPLTRYGLTILAKGRTLSIARARSELGYDPRVTVAEGARRYAAWWRTRES